MVLVKTIDVNGKPVSADDPNRLLWYSAGCGYWTDDWDKLKRTGPGIPCCPRCKCVGMQIDAGKWEKGAKEFDANDPGYEKFLNERKEKCLREFGGMMKCWKTWKAMNR